MTNRADYNYDVKNGTASSYNIMVRASNVTRGSGLVIIQTSIVSFAGTNVNHSGTSASFGVTNISGDTFLVEFSTDAGSSWGGIVYLTSTPTFDYSIYS